MSKPLAIVGVLISAGAAFATAGWESPSMTRVRPDPRLRGLRVAGAAVEGPAADAEEPGAEPEQPETEPGAEPESAQPDPEPEVPEVEDRNIEDVDLCVLDNVLDAPGGARWSQIHVGMEGELSWHTAKDSKEIQSDKTFDLMLRQRQGEPVVFVPDRFTAWQRLRQVADIARRAWWDDCYFGVAEEDAPTVLRFIRFPIHPDVKGVLEEGQPHFVVTVEEHPDDASTFPEKALYKVNGKEIESFPVDLVLAWNEWRKAHPEAAAMTTDPNTSRAVIDAHKFTPVHMVLSVMDVFRGLGIEAERVTGKLPVGRGR